ncbi:mechanosensitive ion channel family protein [Pedobacter sp. SL55]|uniref:mechanosensitive ion channel family protein n=1 Tax=Pedobacter sp. SL55 TaxID=2995161 RepID=UPI00226EBDAD|nr:mechanosensitive ion channel domain-containing protein [Pedobacter sp. SL55]WAC41895.1 mechanosensitive ion channel [Pedobacter sp. SL55]
MELNNYLRDFSRASLHLFKSLGLSANAAAIFNALFLLILAVTATYIVYYVVWRILRLIFIQTIRKTDVKIFETLLVHKAPHYVSLIAPLVVLYLTIPIAFHDYPQLNKLLLGLCDIYLVMVVVWVIMSAIKAGADLLKEKPGFKGKPIDSYLQVIRILLYLFGTVVLFSNLTGKSPIAFFTAMGAISAVLLLMFKDTIMGFVASIQVTTNDIVRIGDWITMPKYGADGDILEINLTTVKVQNFDKTITTIPTYALISDSFQNWRGMRQSGGRRIKRAINIKQSSIRFLKEAELAEFEKIQVISSYIQHRQKDIEKHNNRVNADKSLLINGRNLTNAGLFRKYIDSYISNHSGTNKRMNIMVRQLAPTAQGLPLEIYVFANTIVWAEYEHIMADIFDHLIAAAPYFGLQIYEAEGAGDVKQLEMLNLSKL